MNNICAATKNKNIINITPTPLILEQIDNNMVQHYTPLELFAIQSRSTDMTERLRAHYQFGRHLHHQTRAQLIRLRRDIAPFSIRCSQHVYLLFKHCGKHRIGKNPTIRPSALGRLTKKQVETLAIQELLDGARIEEGDDLLPFL